ncbi:hypothetical protein BJ322DRAFT_1107290 [Thelephora terrestris]|uniref:DUF6533 domain-containing protein n=1 Tax=Thelephora terrestris TaxID=56493 RepID=A0A9P6HJE4_9AGAM|nr:hypothetical protein BJ322DRAFT_1107290 [Thelephora terrestris]
MSSVLRFLVQAGQDVIATKSYSMAVFTILFYDHLLTLADEVKYVWYRQKSWTFWLFVVNRYFPMTYQFWLLATSFGPYSDTKRRRANLWEHRYRIYAVTMRNTPIVVGFAVITVSQFALGIWMTVLVAMGGAEMIPPIPDDAYHVCIFIRHRSLEIAFTSISLFYDFLAFSLILFKAVQSSREMAGVTIKVPSILKNIAEDAMRYFLVIFTSHFVLMMTLLLAPETIQLLPAPGNVVYLPVMISRLMISLRKAADPQQVGGTRPANSTNLPTMEFVRPRGRATGTEGDMPLDTHLESQIATVQINQMN